MTSFSASGGVTALTITSGETGVSATAQTAGPYPGSIAPLHFYLADHLGTAQIEFGQGGWPVWEGQFAPFGGEIVNGAPLSPNMGDGSSTNYKFTGKERDTESGLDYFGARYYSSSMGRFSSPDPGWFFAADPTNPQSWNAYAYALNNPLTNTDPDGYDCVYLNNAGDGVESNDQNSNSGECNQNHGYWVDGTATHAQLYSNNNDVGLTGHTTDSQGNQTQTDSFYTSATGHLSDIVQQIAPGATGTIDLYKAYQNRPKVFVSAQNRADVVMGCAGQTGVGVAKDISGVGHSK